MRRVIFPTGLRQAIEGWTTLDFEWVIMMNGWNPYEPSETYMSEVSYAEYTATGYARVPMSNPSVSVTMPAYVGGAGYVEYHCDSPVFDPMSDGDISGSLLLINAVTTDSDSPLVACTPMTFVADGSYPDIQVPGSGAIRVPTINC